MGESLKKALKFANVDVNDWFEMACDRGMWRNVVDRVSFFFFFSSDEHTQRGDGIHSLVEIGPSPGS